MVSFYTGSFYLATEEATVAKLSEKEGHEEGSQHEHEREQGRVGLV